MQTLKENNPSGCIFPVDVGPLTSPPAVKTSIA
jgi:hypothetical protein